MIGNSTNRILADAIGSVFGRTASAMRERMNESVNREQVGERPRREEYYTSTLMDEMGIRIKENCNSVFDGFGSNSGARVTVDYYSLELPVSEETQFGADIGIRATIESPAYIGIKGLLVQCKRMFGPRDRPTYKMLKGDGERQAKVMLRLTPSSFFMLFNFGEYEELQSRVDGGGFLEPLTLPSGVEQGKQAYTIVPGAPGNPFDLGIAMLPATRVLALSAASRLHHRAFPTDMEKILPGCLPFGDFMARLFSSCFIGDAREEVVRLVTPPGLREANYPGTVDTSDSFEGFAVRRYIDIKVSTQ